jgi:hypothetical protein
MAIERTAIGTSKPYLASRSKIRNLGADGDSYLIMSATTMRTALTSA